MMKSIFTTLTLILTLNFVFGQSADTGNTKKAPFRLVSFATVVPKTPLIIIDGKISPDSVIRISPEAIESTTILKDASATAIYGYRGAAGVTLITTKALVDSYQNKLGSLCKEYKAYIAGNPGKNKINYILNDKPVTDTATRVPRAVFGYQLKSIKKVQFISSSDKPIVKITAKR
jgi:TonB-dependent SusC/RagA subfamily outer membrane receptor